MATYLFSNVKGTSIRFNTKSGVLRFDVGSAADLGVTANGTTLTFKLGTDSLTLLNVGQLGLLSSTNVTFADGSMLLIGDNTISTSKDGSANTLTGGAGDDKLNGGTGNDVIDGGTGRDTAVFTGTRASYLITNNADGFVSVQDQDTVTNGNDGTDTYTMRDSAGALSTAAVTITIIGADEPVIYINPPTTGTGPYPGTSGDDVMSGTGGADTMYGQAGDDEIPAGEGADSIFGGADDDTISGDGGNDTINGGMGRDDLTGGAGADTFCFYLASESTLIDFDRIRDFKAAEGDKIDLSLIDANTVTGDNNAFTLASSFTGVAGQLIYGTTASDYVVQGDVNGDAVADIAIEVRLVRSSSLSGADFIL